MPTVAHEDTVRRLAELTDLEADAWDRYRAELTPLDGPAYAIAEPAAWDSLQMTLAEVTSERHALQRGAPEPGPLG